MQFELLDLGLVDFNQAYQFQKEIFEKVKDGSLESGLIFCRHYPVITLGRSAGRLNVLASEEKLKNNCISIYQADRGGDVTYHGPGQLIVYPIVNLINFKRDIHLFLRKLEEIAVSVLAEFGIRGRRKENLTGVWVGNRKISSIGIAVKNWISFHGLALNVCKDDLTNFSYIRPCGMDIEMTSMESVLKEKISIDEVKQALIRRFKYD